MSPQHARQLDEIAARLAGDDPQLARQLSRHRTLHRGVAQFGFAAAVLVGSGAGLVAVGLGLHYAMFWLFALGAVTSVALPTCARLLVVVVRRRERRRSQFRHRGSRRRRTEGSR